MPKNRRPFPFRSRVAMLALVLSGVGPSAYGDSSIVDRLEFADQALISDFEDPFPLWRRAELRREAGDFNGAFADIARAERLSPAVITSDILRARVHLDTGQALAALEILTPLAVSEPRSVEVHRLRGESLLRLDRFAQAAEAFSRAIDAHSSPTPTLYLDRARAQWAAGPRYFEAVLAGLDQGIERLGPVASLIREAISVEERRGHTDRALQRLLEASRGASRQESWLEWRGRILEAAGRLDEARATYREARQELRVISSVQRSSAAMRALDLNLTQALIRLSQAHAGEVR